VLKRSLTKQEKLVGNVSLKWFIEKIRDWDNKEIAFKIDRNKRLMDGEISRLKDTIIDLEATHKKKKKEMKLKFFKKLGDNKE
jgi:hypothetical protein